MLKKLTPPSLDKVKKINKKFILDLFIVAVIATLVFVVIGLSFLLRKPSQLPPWASEERLRPGKIGEKTETPASLPSIISTTSGMIDKIQTDGLIIQGSGSNFADKKPRVLTVFFADSTITKKIDSKIEYQGLDGLKHFKKGMEVSIEGAENLRGKTEFEAKYIIIF